MSNFIELDINRDIVGPVEGAPTLTLGTATIDSTTAGGFFTGDTSGTQRAGGTTYTYSGKWGGEFYGDAAQFVGGTFGGVGTDGGTNEVNFVGAFGTAKQ